MLCCFVLVHGDAVAARPQRIHVEAANGLSMTPAHPNPSSPNKMPFNVSLSQMHELGCFISSLFHEKKNEKTCFPSSILQLKMTSEVCVIYGKGYKQKHPFFFEDQQISNLICVTLLFKNNKV